MVGYERKFYLYYHWQTQADKDTNVSMLALIVNYYSNITNIQKYLDKF